MKIQVTDSADGTRVLSGEGELDIVTAEPWRAKVSELVTGASGVVLDLTGVTFFDSAGVHFLDLLLREGDQHGVPVRVVAPPGRLPHRVLEIVGMLACVNETLAAALHELDQQR